MTSLESLAPPFWPSRRLWWKLLIGGVYVPLLAVLFSNLMFGVAAFLGGGAAVAVPLFVLVIGGPISIGVLLSPSWRGLIAGCTLVGVGIIGLWAIGHSQGALVDPIMVSVVSGAVTIEMVTGNMRDRKGILGLGLGVVVGTVLWLAYTAGPLLASSLSYGAVTGPPIACVWLSIFFFPELLTRRVGWGGLIVWAVFVALTFGISFVPFK